MSTWRKLQDKLEELKAIRKGLVWKEDCPNDNLLKFTLKDSGDIEIKWKHSSIIICGIENVKSLSKWLDKVTK